MKFHEILIQRKYQYFIISVLCWLCYGFSLKGDFVFDDSVAIVRNSDVTNLKSSINQIFYHDFWGHNITNPESHKSYRPLTILLFRFENKLFGLIPTEMKIINLILHTIVSCGLIQFYSSFINKKNYLPFIASILFAVHPIHTEAVSGIVGRPEMIVSIFLLIVFYIFSQKIRSNENYSIYNGFQWITIFSLSATSILFKENGITLLPILIVYDFIKNLPKINIKRIVMLILITIGFIYARLLLMNFTRPEFKKMDNPIAGSDNILTRILSQNYLYSLNFWLLICPEWLSFDWALGSIPLVESFSDYRIVGIILFYLFCFGILVTGDKQIHLSVLLIVIAFLPASGIIKLGFVIAERVLYLPSIGYCLLISLGIERIYKKISKRIVIILVTLTVIAFIGRTIVRSLEWCTEETLFRSALKVVPNNAKVYYNIARLSSDKNQKSIAFEYYHNAIKLHPDYESAYMNLGNLYRATGDYRQAEINLKKSIEILEEFPAAWMNLGIVLASQKKYSESLRSYQKALKYRKRYPVCLYNLGNLYIDMKNDTMAIKYWRDAVMLDPRQSKAWANILALLDNKGQTDEVLKTSEKALQFNPNNSAILFTRANAFGKIGNYKESERIFKEIIKSKPTYALYHANLGVLYHRWNRTDDAIKSYRQALKLDPHLKSAHDNLKKLRKLN